MEAYQELKTSVIWKYHGCKVLGLLTCQVFNGFTVNCKIFHGLLYDMCVYMPSRKIVLFTNFTFHFIISENNLICFEN